MALWHKRVTVNATVVNFSLTYDPGIGMDSSVTEELLLSLDRLFLIFLYSFKTKRDFL